MKRIGIIGGLGPLATVKFMELLNKKINLLNDEIEMVVINDPTTPDRTTYILDNTKQNPLDKILAMVKKLEICQVDVIVMPCNTASYFYKEITNYTNLPFINIVEETVKFLKEMKIKKVGLLATEGTIKSKIYEDLLTKYKINYQIPNSKEQEIISEIIYKGIKKNKPINLNNFFTVCQSLKNNGCEKIILGCTELSALKQMKNLNQEELLDAMEVLANKTIEFIN